MIVVIVVKPYVAGVIETRKEMLGVNKVVSSEVIVLGPIIGFKVELLKELALEKSSDLS